jgi:tRNA A-37 threonylcarbamoyl transferase component Bud32/DNA-directed RNA polymerase specialized sigma24 family protein
VAFSKAIHHGLIASPLENVGQLMDEPSVELLAKFRQGDESAATELFRRYVSRLTVLARARIAPKIARRFDPEDVVLSAYRSFFLRARDGHFSLAASGDLWRLLVTIVLRKLSRQAAHHTADMRSVDRELALPEGGDSAWDLLRPASRTPTVEEAVAMAELVETCLAGLEPRSRQVAEMRLQGFEIAEIAAATRRSERTIRRILEEFRDHLEYRLSDSGVAPERLVGSRHGLSERCAKPEPSEAGIELIEPEQSASSTPVSIPSEPSPILLSDRDVVLQLHLGSGGSGKVYRALIKGQNQAVAVKVLKKANQRDEAAVARFLDEARTVARLDHPGIVRIHGIGRTRAGGHFIVQEFVDGPNLAEIAAQRSINVAEAIRWLAEAADAIDHSHRRQVIHCDLKPANMLLDAQARVRVTDFGLAHILSDSKVRAAVAGTAGYMAPEQLDASFGPIGPRTDVFGLGAVLFSLLTGRPPFSGETIEVLLRSMWERSPALTLRGERADASEQVDAVCRKCLALSPRERFNTAAELAQSLRLIF